MEKMDTIFVVTRILTALLTAAKIASKERYRPKGLNAIKTNFCNLVTEREKEILTLLKLAISVKLKLQI